MAQQTNLLHFQNEALEESVVQITKCSKVVKGGRRFSFAAVVAVGNKKGVVGIGHGKAKDVPSAIGKATKDARKNLQQVNLARTTIPHTIYGKFGATTVLLRPACEGTGIIAGSATKAVLELAGISNILTKVFGSSNPNNVVKATIDGLVSLRSKSEIQKLRGVKIK